MGEPGVDDFLARLRSAGAEEVPPRRAELRRVADGTRAVISCLVSTEAPLEALERAAEHLEAAVAELSGFPQGRRYEGAAEAGLAGGESGSLWDGNEGGLPRSFFDHSPIIGLANPLAPPLRLDIRDGAVHGSARFGAAYEGPPSSVHGGYVAAAFDELLGMAQSLGGRPGMTGTLTVRYRSPTPLHTDLRFEGTLDRTEGRKLFTSGRCFSGDTLTAEAEGIFISVDFAKVAAMMDARAGRPS